MLQCSSLKILGSLSLGFRKRIILTLKVKCLAAFSLAIGLTIKNAISSYSDASVNIGKLGKSNSDFGKLEDCFPIPTEHESLPLPVLII